MLDDDVGKAFALNLQSRDSLLSGLQVGPRDIIGFESDRYNYAVGVSEEVSEATITPTPRDSNATVAYSVTDANALEDGHQVALEAGLNEFTVSVTSEDESFTDMYTLEIGRGVEDLYGWRAGSDMDGLIAAGNEDPVGITGDDNELWILDFADKMVYHHFLTGRRNDARNIMLVAENSHPAGIWANSSTLYVSDDDADKLFAYRLRNGDRLTDRDIALDAANSSPRDIWSDGETIWVLDGQTKKIFAYVLADGSPQSTSDIDISAATTAPTGIWSDGATMWVANDNSLAITAWDLASGDRVQGKEFNLPTEIGLIEQKSLWSYGPALWVTSVAESKVYAVNLFSDDSTLSILTVDTETILGFSPTIHVYGVGMGSTVETVTITAAPSDSNAVISYASPDIDPEEEGYQVSLSEGVNRVSITVTAEDRVTVTKYVLIIGRSSEDVYGWKAVDDLDGLRIAKNLNPFGLWGNETTTWVADRTLDKVFAYNRDGTRDTNKEFLLHSSNSDPRGIWSDGATLWVADALDAILYAYLLSDGSRTASDDITLDSDNSAAGDIWSDGTTMRVVDVVDAKIYAYSLSDGSRDDSNDIDVSSANTAPTGIWSDGATLWVADNYSRALIAWDLNSRSRAAGRDFLLPEISGFLTKLALWAFDRTLWITSVYRLKVYAFNLPSDDPSLSSLTVSPRDIIGFTPDRFSYSVGVANSITSATISVAPTHANATVTYSFEDADSNAAGRQLDLSPGSEAVSVTVTAEDQTSTQEYTLTIARGVTSNYGWKAVDDLDGLIAAGNLSPSGLWGNNTSTYVADDDTNHIYVYNRDGTRDTSKELSLDVDNGNVEVGGIWSDGTTLWVVDYSSGSPRMFAYSLFFRSRDISKEFELDATNASAGDIWSDNTTMWILDAVAKKVFAYRLSDGSRDESEEWEISEMTAPLGLWSDGDTFWVGETSESKLLAWDSATGTRTTDRDFQIPGATALSNPVALWSDNTTMWVATANQSKIFSFNMPPSVQISFSASSYTVTEGNTITVTATLSTDPKREVTIPLTRTHLSDGSADDYSGIPESLVFLSGETTRSFDFSATDDLIDDDDESIQLSIGTSPHRVLLGTPAGVTFAIQDNDEPPMLVLSDTSVSVPEEDATGVTYTVALATRPDEDVTVTLSGHASTDLTISGATLSAANTLTFTTTNWQTAQTITVKAEDDADGDDDPVTLTHTAGGGEYDGETVDLAVTVVDNDRAIVLSASSLEVQEEDATGASYTVALATQPDQDVTVTVSGHDSTDLTLSGDIDGCGILCFTTDNWQTAQTITVKAEDDTDDADDPVTLTHTAGGGEYDGVTVDLPVTVIDNDRGIVLSASSLEVKEEDATGVTYTVALATQPDEDVTVTVSGHASTDLTLSGLSSSNTLTFTTTNWQTAQTITVKAEDDTDYTNDPVTLTHTAGGGDG